MKAISNERLRASAARLAWGGYDPRLRRALVFLVIVHLPVLLAGFLAPHDPTHQYRDLPFAPPTQLHFIDAEGHFHWRPFVYRTYESPDRVGVYLEDRSRAYPLRFWVRDAPSTSQEASLRLVAVDAPASLHPLGTDRYGRDLLSRMLIGARWSLATGILGASLAAGLGTLLGLLAGFYGGWVDRAINSTLEICISIPWLYMLVAVRAWMPLDAGPVDMAIVLVLIVGSLAWARTARLVRGEARAARELESVLAARGFGASDGYLIRIHVAPASLATALTQLTLLIPRCILAEVTLSFLGLGILEPTPSLGNLLAALRQYSTVVSHQWLFSPAVALILIIVSYHVLANVVQNMHSSANP